MFLQIAEFSLLFHDRTVDLYWGDSVRTDAIQTYSLNDIDHLMEELEILFSDCDIEANIPQIRKEVRTYVENITANTKSPVPQTQKRNIQYHTGS